MASLTPEQAVSASGTFLLGLCYDVVKRRWFWAAATILEEQRAQIPFTRACYKAARLLVKDLQGYGSGEADAHGVFVQWPGWLSIHLGETEKIVHRRCQHCSKARHRSSRLTVNRQISFFDPTWEEIAQVRLALPKKTGAYLCRMWAPMNSSFQTVRIVFLHTCLWVPFFPCVFSRGPWVVRCPKKRGFDTPKAFRTHCLMCAHCVWYTTVGRLNHLYCFD